MERVYRRNIVSQQLNFKVRSLARARLVLTRSRGLLSNIVLCGAAASIYLMDTVMGVVAVYVLMWACPKAWLEGGITTYILTSLHWTRDLLQWTTEAPAGLKLNDILATFISDKLVAILRLWEFFYISFIQLYLTHIISFLLSLQWLGLSVLLAALYDFLKFLNLCLICFYIFTSRLFWLQVSVLRSLTRLFMGQKWNPLRLRVDSCDYDLSQRLLGTLFFTILLFLLPTSGLFYLMFLLLRVCQFTLQSLIRILIVIVNKLVVNLILKLEDACTTPSIITLQFDITECPGNKRTVVGIWNGKRLNLANIQQLVNSQQNEKKCGDEKTKKQDHRLLQHTMMKLIDVTPF